MRKRILKKIAQVSYHRYRLVLSVALVLTIVSLLLSFRLKLKTDVIHLLPPESRAAKVFCRAISSFGTFDYLIAFIQGEDVKKIEDFSDSFANELGKSDLIESIDYKVSEETKEFFKEELLGRPYLYLSSSDIEELRSKLSDGAIRRQIKENRRLLASPISFATKDFIQKDPFNLRSIFKKYIIQQKGPYNFDLSRGYYLSLDKKALLMVIKPKRPPTDIDFDKELLKTIKEAEEKVYKQGVRVDYTGGYIMALDDERMIKRDIILTLSSAFFLVLILFFLAFRRREIFFFVSLPLLMGLAWTVGIAALYPRHLNMVTFGFFPILIGLGVDYAIHIYNRYLEEKGRGKNTLESLEITLSQTGEGNLTAALTTAVAFYSLTFTKFQGLSELGFLSGTGILACLLSMSFILPAILSWQAKRKKFMPKLLHPFGLEKISRFLLKSPKVTLIATILITLILGSVALGIAFDSDFRNLRPRETPAFKVQDEIGEKFGSPSDPLMIIASGKDKEEVLQTNERIIQRIEKLKEEGRMEYYQSPVSLLPSEKRVRENIKELRRFDFERIIATFQEALLENSFRIEAYQNYIDEIRSLEARIKGPLSATSSGKGIERMTKRYLIEDEEGFKTLTLAYPAKKILSPDEVDEFEERIKGGERGIEITGVGIITSELKRLITKDFILATILTFSGVFIMLLIHFRRIKTVILALIPLICGIIWMLGIMRLIGLQMNFVNIIVIPLILGIGIDDSVHIIHRYLEKRPARRSSKSVGGKEGIEDTLHHTGRALVLTSLTTMVGFGSLVFAQYRGLATMGGLALLGVGLCLITSLTILPALLKITENTNRHELKR